MRRRATGSVERLEKETRIIEAAGALLEHDDYRAITVDRIAREAGEAKGTIYLYFRTREDLFLALLERDLAAWHTELTALLAPPPAANRAPEADRAPHAERAPDADRAPYAERASRAEPSPHAEPLRPLARALAGSLAARPRMVRLLALSQAILERNVSRERAVRYKRFLRELVGTSAGAFAQRLPWLGLEGGVRFMVYLYALVVGLTFQTEPAPVVRAVIAEEEMHEFELDFRSELTEHTLVYLEGLRAGAAVGRKEEV